eukprot:5603338-Pleurochrysis_carterae.AAC.1
MGNELSRRDWRVIGKNETDVVQAGIITHRQHMHGTRRSTLNKVQHSGQQRQESDTRTKQRRKGQATSWQMSRAEGRLRGSSNGGSCTDTSTIQNMNLRVDHMDTALDPTGPREGQCMKAPIAPAQFHKELTPNMTRTRSPSQVEKALANSEREANSLVQSATLQIRWGGVAPTCRKQRNNLTTKPREQRPSRDTKRLVRLGYGDFNMKPTNSTLHAVASNTQHKSHQPNVLKVVVGQVTTNQNRSPLLRRHAQVTRALAGPILEPPKSEEPRMLQPPRGKRVPSHWNQTNGSIGTLPYPHHTGVSPPPYREHRLIHNMKGFAQPGHRNSKMMSTSNTQHIVIPTNQTNSLVDTQWHQPPRVRRGPAHKGRENKHSSGSRAQQHNTETRTAANLGHANARSRATQECWIIGDRGMPASSGQGGPHTQHTDASTGDDKHPQPNVDEAFSGAILNDQDRRPSLCTARKAITSSRPWNQKSGSAESYMQPVQFHVRRHTQPIQSHVRRHTRDFA